MILLLLAASFPLMYSLLFGTGGYLQLREYREELLKLQRENHLLQEENRAIMEKIQKLKNDPAEVERLAREEFNLARPGDIIITLPEGQSSAQSKGNQ